MYIFNFNWTYRCDSNVSKRSRAAAAAAAVAAIASINEDIQHLTWSSETIHLILDLHFTCIASLNAVAAASVHSHSIQIAVFISLFDVCMYIFVVRSMVTNRIVCMHNCVRYTVGRQSLRQIRQLTDIFQTLGEIQCYRRLSFNSTFTIFPFPFKHRISFFE